jgi:hypothetical protein
MTEVGGWQMSARFVAVTTCAAICSGDWFSSFLSGIAKLA